MLTAFSYYDPEEENRIQQGMKNTAFFEREREIAHGFAASHQGLWRGTCPACGQEAAWPIFERDGVTYERCRECGSLFAAVKEADVAAYFAQEDLRALRCSDEYQENSTESRSRRWDDILAWLGFRAFRYLGHNEGLSVVDYGNRWQGFVGRIRSANFCGSYFTRDSLLAGDERPAAGSVDIVLAMNYLERLTQPEQFFAEAEELLSAKGLLVFSIKAGNGFDILKLRGNNPNLLPYEHNFLPSRVGIEKLLERMGFELLEYTTPGTFDLNYVISNEDKLGEHDYFTRYFLDHATPNAKAEFQRFLQRSGMSSYAQLIARKKVRP